MNSYASLPHRWPHTKHTLLLIDITLLSTDKWTKRKTDTRHAFIVLSFFDSNFLLSHTLRVNDDKLANYNSKIRNWWTKEKNIGILLVMVCAILLYIYTYIYVCFFKLAQWEKKKKTIIIDKHILLEKPLRL